jgi:hypothetical protein
MKVVPAFAFVAGITFGYAASGATPTLATPQQLEVIRTALQNKLKDADSAKFMNVRMLPADQGMSDICGKVNAKNSYGAYAGYRTFYGEYFDATNGSKASAFILIIQDQDSPVADRMCEKQGFSNS